MGVPAVAASASFTANTATLAKAWPTHRLDDIGVMLVQTNAQAASFSDAQGFVAANVTQQNIGTPGAAGAVGLMAFLCRATSGAMATPTLADSGDHTGATFLVIRGVPRSIALADIVIVAGTAASATAVSFPAATTDTDDCLIVNVVANATDVTTAQFSGETNAGLLDLAEIRDENTNVGNGGGIAVVTGGKHVAGSLVATTGTLATGSAQALMTIVFPSMSAPPTAAFSNISPAEDADLAGTVDAARFTKILFRLEVSAGGLPVVFGFCGDAPSNLPVIIYDGTDFTPLFEEFSSVIDVGGGVYDFSILPLGGWWDAPTIRGGLFAEAP
jgi:hypothetical protein